MMSSLPSSSADVSFAKPLVTPAKLETSSKPRDSVQCSQSGAECQSSSSTHPAAGAAAPRMEAGGQRAGSSDCAPVGQGKEPALKPHRLLVCEDVVDVENEDLDDCVLLKIDTSRRRKKQLQAKRPDNAVSSTLVIIDSDEEGNETPVVRASVDKSGDVNPSAKSSTKIISSEKMASKPVPDSDRDEFPDLDLQVETEEENTDQAGAGDESEERVLYGRVRVSQAQEALPPVVKRSTSPLFAEAVSDALIGDHKHSIPGADNSPTLSTIGSSPVRTFLHTTQLQTSYCPPSGVFSSGSSAPASSMVPGHSQKSLVTGSSAQTLSVSTPSSVGQSDTQSIASGANGHSLVLILPPNAPQTETRHRSPSQPVAQPSTGALGDQRGLKLIVLTDQALHTKPQSPSPKLLRAVTPAPRPSTQLSVSGPQQAQARDTVSQSNHAVGTVIASQNCAVFQPESSLTSTSSRSRCLNSNTSKEMRNEISDQADESHDEVSPVHLTKANPEVASAESSQQGHGESIKPGGRYTKSDYVHALSNIFCSASEDQVAAAPAPASSGTPPSGTPADKTLRKNDRGTDVRQRDSSPSASRESEGKSSSSSMLVKTGSSNSAPRDDKNSACTAGQNLSGHRGKEVTNPSTGDTSAVLPAQPAVAPVKGASQSKGKANEDKKSGKCHKCSITCINRFELVIHVILDHGPSNYMNSCDVEFIKCPFCQNRFHRKCGMRNHLRRSPCGKALLEKHKMNGTSWMDELSASTCLQPEKQPSTNPSRATAEVQPEPGSVGTADLSKSSEPDSVITGPTEKVKEDTFPLKKAAPGKPDGSEQLDDEGVVEICSSPEDSSSVTGTVRGGSTTTIADTEVRAVVSVSERTTGLAVRTDQAACICQVDTRPNSGPDGAVHVSDVDAHQPGTGSGTKTGNAETHSENDPQVHNRWTKGERFDNFVRCFACKENFANEDKFASHRCREQPSCVEVSSSVTDKGTASVQQDPTGIECVKCACCHKWFESYFQLKTHHRQVNKCRLHAQNLFQKPKHGKSDQGACPPVPSDKSANTDTSKALIEISPCFCFCGRKFAKQARLEFHLSKYASCKKRFDEAREKNKKKRPVEGAASPEIASHTQVTTTSVSPVSQAETVTVPGQSSRRGGSTGDKEGRKTKDESDWGQENPHEVIEPRELGRDEPEREDESDGGWERDEPEREDVSDGELERDEPERENNVSDGGLKRDEPERENVSDGGLERDEPEREDVSDGGWESPDVVTAYSKCTVCNEEFLDERSLQFHMKNSVLCRERLGQPEASERGGARVKLTPASVVCKACQKPLGSDACLAVHLAESESCANVYDDDNDRSLPRYSCQTCGKILRSDEALAKHLQSSRGCWPNQHQESRNSVGSVRELVSLKKSSPKDHVKSPSSAAIGSAPGQADPIAALPKKSSQSSAARPLAAGSVSNLLPTMPTPAPSKAKAEPSSAKLSPVASAAVSRNADTNPSTKTNTNNTNRNTNSSAKINTNKSANPSAKKNTNPNPSTNTKTNTNNTNRDTKSSANTKTNTNKSANPSAKTNTNRTNTNATAGTYPSANTNTNTNTNPTANTGPSSNTNSSAQTSSAPVTITAGLLAARDNDDCSSDDSSKDSVDSRSSSSEDDARIEYRCTRCSSVFARKSSLKKHLAENGVCGKVQAAHGKRKKIRCEACARKFRDLVSLQAHLLQQQFCFRELSKGMWRLKSAPDQTCAMCQKKYLHRKELGKHCFKDMTCRLKYVALLLETFSEVRAPSPAVDSVQVSSSSTVKESVVENTRTNTETPSPNSAISVSGVPADVKNSNCGETELLWDCGQCKECFTSQDDFAKHVRVSVRCKKFYAALKSENPPKTLQAYCTPCKRSFKTIPSYRVHDCKLCTERCKSCDSAFSSVRSLKFHQLSSRSCRHLYHKEELSLSNVQAASEMTQNLSNSSQKKSYPCAVCNEKFDVFRLLLEHSQTHVELSDYQCDRCSKKFQHYNRLVSHLAYHERVDKEGLPSSDNVEISSTSGVCESDAKPGEDEDELSETDPHKCYVCDKVFSRFESFKEHIFSHASAAPFSCSICRQSFPTEATLTTHISSKHEKSRTSCRRKAPAEVSGGDLSPPRLRVQFRVRDALSAVDSYTSCACETCGQHFASQRDRRKHMAVSVRCRPPKEESAPDSGVPCKKAKVSAAASVQCVFCSLMFESDAQKREHVESSDTCRAIMRFMMENRYYQLDEAGKKDLSSDDPSRCEFCSGQFQDKVGHILGSGCYQSMEEAIGRYRQAAVTPASPLEEVKVQESAPSPQDKEKAAGGEKTRGKWICLLCEKTMTVFSSHFMFHRRIILEKISGRGAISMRVHKPVECPMCLSVFKTRECLKKHMVTHRAMDIVVPEELTHQVTSGDHKKPKVCQQCQKNFRSLVGLKTHLRSTHNKKKRVKDKKVLKKVVTATPSSKFKKFSSYEAHRRLTHKPAEEKLPKTPTETKGIKKTAERRFIGRCSICRQKVASLPGFRFHLKRFHRRKEEGDIEHLLCPEVTAGPDRPAKPKVALKPVNEVASDESVGPSTCKKNTCDVPVKGSSTSKKNSLGGAVEKSEAPHRSKIIGSSSTTTSMAGISSHESYSKDSHNLKCKICSKTFEYPHCLRRHLSKDHNLSQMFSCQYCGMSYPRKTEWLQHEPVCKKFCVCKICNKETLKLHGLKTHLRCIHGINSIREYLKTTAKKKSAKQRAALVKIDNGGDVVSDIQSTPSWKPQKTCPICKKFVSYGKRYTDHLKTHMKPFRVLVMEKTLYMAPDSLSAVAQSGEGSALSGDDGGLEASVVVKRDPEFDVVVERDIEPDLADVPLEGIVKEEAADDFYHPENRGGGSAVSGGVTLPGSSVSGTGVDGRRPDGDHDGLSSRTDDGLGDVSVGAEDTDISVGEVAPAGDDESDASIGVGEEDSDLAKLTVAGEEMVTSSAKLDAIVTIVEMAKTPTEDSSDDEGELCEVQVTQCDDSDSDSDPSLEGAASDSKGHVTSDLAQGIGEENSPAGLSIAAVTEEEKDETEQEVESGEARGDMAAAEINSDLPSSRDGAQVGVLPRQVLPGLGEGATAGSAAASKVVPKVAPVKRPFPRTDHPAEHSGGKLRCVRATCSSSTEVAKDAEAPTTGEVTMEEGSVEQAVCVKTEAPDLELHAQQRNVFRAFGPAGFGTSELSSDSDDITFLGFEEAPKPSESGSRDDDSRVSSSRESQSGRDVAGNRGERNEGKTAERTNVFELIAP
ncbi:uncharacterized protein LOC106012046 [Aplysia californica]|uniref:Uncharacterized protein LOC106012046 n=1 Tax=Aplysia californica TaxID=6500 RepID=A0ABM1A1Y1_APLCA|nr:uncharacterized protein LOC106012046 [Aplysia californica]XP_035826196.1 uncharacterized protein LOC106012046 [Aplysia californica]